MSTRQFAITVFHLIIFVLTSLAVFADDPAVETDELPPVPTFKVPPEQKDEAKEQSEKVADKPADVAPVENWDELPPIPTYTPQSKPKEETKEQSKESDEKRVCPDRHHQSRLDCVRFVNGADRKTDEHSPESARLRHPFAPN